MAKNSFKKSMNGRYQIKRAMHKGRVKARYKKCAKNDPYYNEKQSIFEVIMSIFILLIIIGFLF